MSHWIMGVLATLFAMVGLFLASGAHDAGILIFGLGLFVSGMLFAWWMIKAAYDESEAS